MSKNRYPTTMMGQIQPPPAGNTVVALSALEQLGVPCKLTVLIPTQLPGSGVCGSTFTTADKNKLMMSDYGGYALKLTDWGVIVTDRAKGGRILVPWSQVQAVEFAPDAVPSAT